jgi:hypothetical protein
MKQEKCSDCKSTLPVPPPVGGSGRATLPDGRQICYPCATKRQVEELKDRSRPFVAYVSSDEKSIQTWTGGHLMRITACHSCKLTRQSWTHDARTYRSIHAVDVHGGHWYGRGSAGIAIRLRATKG